MRIEDYEAVLLQRGTADSYADFIDASEKDLKQAYGCLLYTSDPRSSYEGT